MVDWDKSEGFLERICKTLPVGICVFNTEFQYLYINDWLAAINGLAVEEHLGKNIEQLLPASLTEQLVPQLRHVIDTGEPILRGTAEGETVARSDAKRSFQHSFYPIKNNDGSVEGISCAVQDITAQKQVQDDLKERESRLQATLEIALDPIITTNVEGIIESANTAALRLFQYDRNELIGMNVNFLIDEPYHSTHDNYLQRHMQTGEAKIIGIGREINCLRKNKTTFPAELHVTESQIKGITRMFTATIHDVTARKNAETLLQKRQKELEHVARLSTMGEMAAGIAHELNQPLGAISNYASNCLYIIESGKTVEVVDDLEEIVRISHRCGEIIRRVTSYSKKREPHRTLVNMSAMIADVLAFIEREARLNEVVVRCFLPEQLLWIPVDGIQIQQLLLNLTRNAIDAMAHVETRPRVLTIKVENRSKDEVELSIHDTGNGIDVDVKERLFEPFVTTKPDGLGMGLAISKSIVEAHKGSIEIDTDLVQGTLARIILPSQESLT